MTSKINSLSKFVTVSAHVDIRLVARYGLGETFNLLYFMFGVLSEAQVAYQKKLKEYRWLKKRDEILKRDNYECQKCHCIYMTTEDEYNNEPQQLFVHHIRYIGANPWDTPNKYLITVCDMCHEDLHALRRHNREEEYLTKVMGVRL